jgi:hypothetical protein
MTKRLNLIAPGQTVWYNCQKATVVRQFTVGEFKDNRTDLRLPNGTVVTTSCMDPAVHADTPAELRRRSILLSRALHG